MAQWADFYREKFQGAVVVEKEDGFFWGYPQEGYFMIGDCYVIPEKRNKGLWMEYHKELEYEAMKLNYDRIVGTMDIGTQNIERALTSAFKCGYEIMEIKENRIIVVTKVL